MHARRLHLLPRVLGALGIVGLVAACGGPTLTESDPSGAQACELFASISTLDDETQRALAMINVGDLATEASTEAIASAASPVPGSEGAFFQVDEDALRTACEDNGVSIP